MVQLHSPAILVSLSSALLLTGCMSTLVRDDVKLTVGLDGHCAGASGLTILRWR